jgi:predicted phage tail protein
MENFYNYTSFFFKLGRDIGLGASMRKRSGSQTISIAFVLLLIFGAFSVVVPGTVIAAQDGDYTYTVTDGNATLTGYVGAGGAITIPSTLGGYPTQAIGGDAFLNNTNVTSVTIPSSVTRIGSYAFFNCTSLTSVSIPNNVTYIGVWAFSYCTSLISVTIPNRITTIEYSLFAYCTSLISVTIPNSVVIIQDAAFRNCYSLVSVTLPNSVTYLGDAVFVFCTSLTSITIPSGVTFVGTEAFAYCTVLTSVIVNGNVGSFENHSFYNCRSLVSITFYGLVAPTIIGEGWVNGTPAGLRGHAYAASNFPPPGESFHGLIMGAIIPTVPSAPTSFYATPGNVHVLLTWNLPADTGGSSITGYKAYRAATETGTYSPIGPPTDLYYSDNDLTNGQTYWYKVSAVNAIGEGATTTPQSAIPYTVPSSPTGLTASAGTSKVNLNWTAPASNGGRAIDYYVVYQDGVALPSHPTGLTAIITGLTNGLSYSFTVAAHNLAGLSAVSNAAVAMPNMVPDAPTGLTAVAGDAQVALNWTAPAFDGGNAIDYYVVYQDGVALAAHPTGLATVINGLTNGQSYSFTVAAHNSAGLGAQSNAASSKPYTVPGAPTGLTAIAGSAKVTLNWTAPAFDGGRAIDYYVVYQDDVALPENLTGLTTVINGLNIGQEYSFTVAAHNLAGLGAQSNEASATPIMIPDAPIGLTAVAGDAQVTLNWTAPAFDGGHAIDYYVVYQDGVPLPDNLTGLATVITGLTNGQTYYFAVAAHNLAGLGAQSNAVSSTPYTVPDAPTGLSSTAGTAQVSLNWTAPAFDGGHAIDYYVVYQDGVALPDNPTGLTTVISGLTNGQEYSFTVAAHNLAGQGAQSDATSATPFITVPDAPTGLVAIVGSNAKVALNWTAPAFDGGDTIDYYVVYQDGIALPDNLTGLTTVITGLTNGQEYSFTVAAHNLAGLSVPSVAASATPYGVPGAPTGLRAVAGNANVTLNWTAPTSDEGSAIEYYVVYQDGEALFDHPTGLTTVVTGLSIGHEYSFTVAAHNLAGQSALSDVATATPFGVPSAPILVSAVAGHGSITLTWTAPANNGGSAITGYKIYWDAANPPVLNQMESGSTVLSVEVTGLTAGTTYYVTVTAINAAGESVKAVALSAMPYTTPSAPTLSQPTADGTQVALSWSANGNGGSSITGYKLYRSGSENGTYELISSPAGLNHTDVGLTEGQTYWYKVSAVNAAGEGAKSTAVSVLVPEPGATIDYTTLILVMLILIVLVLAVMFFILRRNKGKK